MSGSPLYFLTISELAGLIREKQVSPVEVTEAILSRIEALDGRYSSYATVMADHAMDSAQRAENEIAAGRYLGPLHGVPVAVKDNLAPAKQFGEYYVTNEFTHHSRYCATDGLVLLGDAYCFLDPVFSSGLMLALKSGVMAADAVPAAIEADDFSPVQFEGYATTLREGIENMRKLVYVFYHPNFTFRDLIGKYPDLAGDITDCLSGDVNKDFSRLWAAVGEFAPIPDKLPYGMPKVPGKGIM